ncbi:hypothetical protein HUU40_26875 [candidate division KSB1 bacterium]|nr:hypothetical protein [candidate division KSB1 bacterium]
MTQLLTKAFEEASHLSEYEQNLVANWLLAELAAELHWSKAFAESGNALEQLANEALLEHSAGRTRILAPESM